jgi:hypothetical protein
MPVEELSDGHHGVGHPQVEVLIRGRSAEVDEELAPLIEEMWLAHIDTIMSCQQHDTPEFAEHGHPTSWVWIMLPGPDAQQFCTVIAGEYDEDSESLYQRISDEKGSKRTWWYDCHAMNYGEEEEGAEAEVTFDISVRFPVEDLPEVARRMQAWNEVEWVDAQAMHRAHPDSFEVPPDAELDAIKPKTFIKVGATSHGGRTERFWLAVEAPWDDEVLPTPDTIIGTVNNALVEIPLDLGQRVYVERRHVMGVMTEEEQAEQEAYMRNVAEGGRAMDHTFATREEADVNCAAANGDPKKPPHLPDLEVREVEGGYGLFWSKRRRTRRSAAEPPF